jgi:hypothetical protein
MCGTNNSFGGKKGKNHVQVYDICKVLFLPTTYAFLLSGLRSPQLDN